MPRDVIPAELEIAETVSREGITAAMYRLEELWAEVNRIDHLRYVRQVNDDMLAKRWDVATDQQYAFEDAILDAEPSTIEDAFCLLLMAGNRMRSLNELEYNDADGERVERAIGTALRFLMAEVPANPKRPDDRVTELPAQSHYTPRGLDGSVAQPAAVAQEAA